MEYNFYDTPFSSNFVRNVIIRNNNSTLHLSKFYK